MASSVLLSLVCVLCVVVIPAAWAEYCTSYLDTDDVYHENQKCDKYCCGDCRRKYCCSDKKDRLIEKNQDLCPERFGNSKKSNIALIVGSIFGAVIPVVLCVALIICCVVPCCFCYKKCRKRRNQRHITVINSSGVVNPPQHPSYPGYQSVPGGPPMATAPPSSYRENTSPTHFPAAFAQGQPLHPFQPPSQLNAPSPYSDELEQPPYNPAYRPNS